MSKTCTSCHTPVVPGTRAVVFLDVAWHRACWLAETVRLVDGPLTRRLRGVHGNHANRCRLAG